MGITAEAASCWLADLLGRHEHVEIVGRAVDADAAERLIRELAPDVVFVDIEMPGRDGLAVVDRLDGNTRGVVVAAFEQYAVEGFDTPAVGYLLKPVTDGRLTRTLARPVARDWQRAQRSMAPPRQRHRRRPAPARGAALR